MSKESRKRQGFGEKDNGGYEWTSRKDPIMMGGHDVSHPRETVKYPCPQRSNPDHWHPSEIRAAPYEQPNNRLKPVHSRTRPAGPDLLPRPLLPDLNFDTSPRTGLSTATASSSSSSLPGLRESSFMHSETELYRSSVDHLPAFYRHQSNIHPDDRPIDRGAHLFRSHNVGDRRMTSGELASDSLPRRSSASPAKHIHLDGDRQPLQNRRSASPRPHPFSYQPYRDYDSAGRPGGSVGAFFTRRPGVERPEQPSVPLRSRSFEDNRYPTLPPPSAGGTGPDRHSSAWFAPARPQRPREMHNWLPDHIRAYETGYEDAIRSVENGVFGVHGIHYRHPLLVQREIPPDSASGPRHFDVDDVGAQRFPGPLQHAARGTHPYSDITPYRPDYHGSPYDRHYAKDPGHREYFARHDLPRDSYHSRAQALYPYTQPPYAVHPPRSQRQLISCYPCRTRKLKCDGQKPCAQCSRRGSEAECAYATHVRRRGKGKRADGEDSSGESTVGRNNAGSDIETPRSFLGRSLSDFHEESMPIKPKEEKDTQSSPPPDIELDEKKEDMVDGD